MPPARIIRLSVIIDKLIFASTGEEVHIIESRKARYPRQNATKNSRPIVNAHEGPIEQIGNFPFL